MAKCIMIQGCGSNVGKSLIVAGLCRAFTRRGLKTLPFKPQNMSNNAAVTGDGGEIGRAQALQALACRVAPHTDMNPVLLKPQTETGAQVILCGERFVTVEAQDYAELKPSLMPYVLDSFRRLCTRADLVVVEGAGSPAETNLRQGDIANMGFSVAADVPVVLVGDIDQGGVIAQLVGSHAVLSLQDRNMIKGFIINKFRGDATIFDDGLLEIVERTGWHSIGVLPWFAQAARLPAEDATDIPAATGNGAFKVAVPKLSRIANFDDLDPLKLDPGVTVEMVSAGQPLPGDADLVLIPGSKSTIGDLRFFRQQGWDIDLQAHIRRGGHVLGICGGYQMLGKRIIDAQGIEGEPGEVSGLGHLDVVTEILPNKRLAEVSGYCPATDTKISGYEIHAGITRGADCARPWLIVEGRNEGAQSANGRVRGCYLHGLFASDGFRNAFLRELGVSESGFNFNEEVDNTLNALADHIETGLDVEFIWDIATQGSS
jgi:adenosylcobyric acid synthase